MVENTKSLNCVQWEMCRFKKVEVSDTDNQKQAKIVLLEKFKFYSTVKSFLFVGHLILCFSWVGQLWISDPNRIFIHLSHIAYISKPTLSVHRHVHLPKITKFCAPDIKWFPSTWSALDWDRVAAHTHMVAGWRLCLHWLLSC